LKINKGILQVAHNSLTIFSITRYTKNEFTGIKKRKEKRKIS